MSKFINNYPKVILFGDSLSENAFSQDGNWGGKLQSLLKRKADVINRGYSGYNTSLLKLVGPKIFNQNYLKDVACLTLCIGANDSWDETNIKFNPYVPLDKYKQNLIDIINFLNKNGLSSEKILLITPPTIIIDKWVEYCKVNKEYVFVKTPEKTKVYADAMIEIGKELNIKVFDAFEVTNKDEHRDKAFIDGLHFSEYGAQLIFNLIKDDVQKLVVQFRDSELDNFPTYNDIDYNNLDTFYD